MAQIQCTCSSACTKTCRRPKATSTGSSPCTARGWWPAYDAAVIRRGEDGAPTIVHKKRTGHHVLTGIGVGALLTVLTPFVAIPFAAAGAGAGALARHAEDSLPKKRCRGVGRRRWPANEAALVIASKKTEPGRLEQMLPGASRRLASVLDWSTTTSPRRSSRRGRRGMTRGRAAQARRPAPESVTARRQFATVAAGAWRTVIQRMVNTGSDGMLRSAPPCA